MSNGLDSFCDLETKWVSVMATSLIPTTQAERQKLHVRVLVLYSWVVQFWLTVTTYQPAFQEGGSCVIFEDGTIVDLAPIGIVSSPEACFQACKAFSAAQYIPSGAPGYDCTCTDGSVSTMTVCSSDTTYLFIHPAGTAVGDNGLGPAPSGYVRKRAGRASAKFRLTSR